MRRRDRQPLDRAGSPADVADRLHSAAIHLLRRLRAEDAAAGLTGPQLSALSVIVFRGPVSLGALAAAEQVRPPTISRLIRELERQKLVERAGHDTDARVQHVCATEAGKRLLAEGRARRVAALTKQIAALPATSRRALRSAVDLLEQLGDEWRQTTE
jgi:DNA-binding MarR family transcriptional regulator